MSYSLIVRIYFIEVEENFSDHLLGVCHDLLLRDYSPVLWVHSLQAIQMHQTGIFDLAAEDYIDPSDYEFFKGIDFGFATRTLSDEDAKVSIPRRGVLYPSISIVIPIFNSEEAVNVGLSYAKGEYISIIEPDDYIDMHMFEKLITAARKTNFPDVVKAAFCVLLMLIPPMNICNLLLTITAQLNLLRVLLLRRMQHVRIIFAIAA